MHEGLGPGVVGGGGRAWLAAVLLLFCLPLFINLGEQDLENDEAIYSFAIDRMLASGDWLVPKALPHDALPFFEKPPLKFWIVALPIGAGLLPPTEFGLRFWDAAFGAAAFVYVFFLGTRLLNPLCGFVAVLMLFAHAPLLFSHGLRSNNMESALMLAYCAGVFHYLAWARGTVRLKPASTTNPRGRLKADAIAAGGAAAARRGSAVRQPFQGTTHIVAVALYFVLAFMTKFVAALFLPLILGMTALAVREHRRLLARDWRAWASASVLALALIVPWFAFASARFGVDFWRGIFGVHVYERFTGFLDPGHLRPWNYYLAQMIDFWDSAALVVMFAGLVLLAVWTARRVAPDVAVIVLWFVVPMAAISAVTSKIYHYAYPFLPALALGGGYLAALSLAVGHAPFDRALERFYIWLPARWPRAAGLLRQPLTRVGLGLAIAACLALAAGSLLFGQVQFMVGRTELKSAGILRPGIAAVVFAVLYGVRRPARRMVLALLVVSFLPFQGYRDSLMLLGVAPHPKRSVSDCIRTIQAGRGDVPRGLRVQVDDTAVSQSLFYYFERIRPWLRDGSRELLPTLAATEPAAAGASAPVSDEVIVVLPGVYASCSHASTLG